MVYLTVPASVKALARDRGCFGGRPSVWPLRNSEGLTWAEVRANATRNETQA